MFGPRVVYVERPRPRVGLKTGTVQPDEFPLLQQLIGKASQFSGPIIEIGTLFGINTLNLLKYKPQGVKLITVDNYSWNPLELFPDDHWYMTSTILANYIESGEVDLIRQDKNDFYQSYSGSPPAMVFLDANHSYEHTLMDIDWAIRAGSRYITGHDYSPEFPGVVQAVEERGGLENLCGTVWQLKQK